MKFACRTERSLQDCLVESRNWMVRDSSLQWLELYVKERKKAWLAYQGWCYHFPLHAWRWRCTVRTIMTISTVERLEWSSFSSWASKEMLICLILQWSGDQWNEIQIFECHIWLLISLWKLSDNGFLSHWIFHFCIHKDVFFHWFLQEVLLTNTYCWHLFGVFFCHVKGFAKLEMTEQWLWDFEQLLSLCVSTVLENLILTVGWEDLSSSQDLG